MLEQNNQVPEGWHPDMKPMPNDGANLAPIEVIDGTEGVTVTSEEQTKEEEGREYWRKKFEDANAQNRDYAPYRNILENLKTNGDLVDVLQQHINGEVAVARRGTLVNPEEEDEYGNVIEPNEQGAETQNVQPTEEQLTQARQAGARDAAAQAELKQFMDNLLSTGVPDHIADKFVETISNPSGFNVADLYAAFMNKETRDKEATPERPVTEKTIPKGVPVSSAGGSTDKPTGDRFKETESDGHNFVSNPNMM